MRKLVVAVAIVVGVVACAGADDQTDPAEEPGDPGPVSVEAEPVEPEPEPEPERHEDQASIDVACQHAFNVASDAGEGLLTVEETRAKWREVHDSLQYTRIASQSAKVMADLTAAAQGDTTSLEDGSLGRHVQAVARRCNRLAN